jgi:hypothetical protein
VEKSSSSLFYGIIPAFAWRLSIAAKKKLKTMSLWAENGTKNLPKPKWDQQPLNHKPESER